MESSKATENVENSIVSIGTENNAAEQNLENLSEKLFANFSNHKVLKNSM